MIINQRYKKKKNITLSWLVSATIAIEQFSIIIDREN